MKTQFILILISIMLFTLTFASNNVALPASTQLVLVTSNADSGPGTLRQRLLDATVGTEIKFDPLIFPANAPKTIALQSPLPALDDGDVTIDASVAGVILDGKDAGSSANGLQLESDDNRILGLEIWRFDSSGIFIGASADNNVIGGSQIWGEGNYIAHNGVDGIDIRGNGNSVAGNIIGIGNGNNGVAVWEGASNNQIGISGTEFRNIISGNGSNGIWVSGTEVTGNVIINNQIGTNASGTSAVPNGLHGIELREGAHDNVIGGVGTGNLLSGNSNHGLVILDGAHHNSVYGNLIGPDVDGMYSLGGHPFGGVDIAGGAHHNQIGGTNPGEGNVISGNKTDGIAIFGSGTTDNVVAGNLIGVAADGVTPLPNLFNDAGLAGQGVYLILGAVRTLVDRNIIAFNDGYGIRIENCGGNRTTQNSIYDNMLGTINTVCPITLTLSAADATTLTGITAPNAQVEFYSSDSNQARKYEGSATSDGTGAFSFNAPSGFSRINVTALAIDENGNSSSLAPPLHIQWTIMMVLNGDNDLDAFMQDTFNKLAQAGASPRVNLLVLLDGPDDKDSGVYDLTDGVATEIDVPFNPTGELNLGDGQVISDFVNWSRSRHPSKYTMLSIVNHGGGWAPGSDAIPPGTLPVRRRAWQAGSSGLSWDHTGDGTDYDYVDSQEIRQTMMDINNSSGMLDVVFFDVCLMGMTETAYQLKGLASFLVASQNIGWAPLGADNRYVRTIHNFPPAATPRELSEMVVENYADALPETGHPLTISALALDSLPDISTAVSELALALSSELADPQQLSNLQAAYQTTQKLDYDSDFLIEPHTDGFVDLYDLTIKIDNHFVEPQIVTAASNLQSILDDAIVAHKQLSGNPWFAPDLTWDLAETHGLSIFLPLGEDLVFQIEDATQLKLRDLYAADDLLFVAETPAWKDLIEQYYTLTGVPENIPTGPVDGLQEPDIHAPVTTISTSFEKPVRTGDLISIIWQATDDVSGVQSAQLWHRANRSLWHATTPIQSGTSGEFQFTVNNLCLSKLAVRATDKAGNVESISSGDNSIAFAVAPCLAFAPIIAR